MSAALEPTPHNSIDVSVSLRRNEFHLNAHFRAPGNRVTALWGPSGSGKTTLLRCIAGLEKPHHGTITLNSRQWLDTPSNFSKPVHQRHIAYVFQEPSLFEHMSVQANLEYGYFRAKKRTQRFSFEQMVQVLRLHDLLGRNPATLSVGQQQRVAIGRALLSQPDMLLLDEPVSALDAGNRNSILSFLVHVRYNTSIPVLYVTHHIDEVARIADWVVIMENGTVVAKGPKITMMHRIYQKDASSGTDDHAQHTLFHDGRDCPYALAYQ